MAQREQLTNEQKRLLRIIARMPLASAANLAPILGLGRGPGEADAGSPARRRLDRVRGAGHDRAEAAPLVPDQKGPGPALLSPTTSIRRPGKKQGPQGRPLSTRRANCPRTTGSGSPWTTAIRSTWRIRTTPPSHPVTRLLTMPPPTLTTSTRPGPPRRGASRPPCGGWPCWSRYTAWPPTWSAAAGSTCPPATRRSPERPG